MKIITIIGARPQFIKAVMVSRLIRKNHKEILLHTGQHYDQCMSDIFFKDLDLPRPDYNLDIGSASHAEQTANMLIDIEKVLLKEKADSVLVYGDTNSTLAGGLAAAKLNLPVFHIEAGLRSYNKKMPEEINRIITDHLSSLLFCPTQTAVDNLKSEGIKEGVFFSGDVMYDSTRYFYKKAKNKSDVLNKLKLKTNNYYLTTIHRVQNTDNKDKLAVILDTFNSVNKEVIFPIHPRTKKQMDRYCFMQACYPNIRFIKPVGYFAMLVLIKNARKVLTDSGGIQKEAFFLKTPCITLRDETEWPETLIKGKNKIVKINKKEIIKEIENSVFSNQLYEGSLFGDSKASQKIVKIIEEFDI